MLDIKPYLPFDRVQQLRVPSWVEDWGSRGQFKRHAVSFTPQVEKFLQQAVQDGQLRFYGPGEEGHTDLFSTLTEVLSLDVRAARHGRGQATSRDSVYTLRFDKLELHFVTLDEGVRVVDVTFSKGLDD